MIIAVIGQSQCPPALARLAENVGKEIARRGHTLVCGGMGGVMEAACRGAKEAGGVTLGILPGKDKKDANPFIDYPILTAMSHARNAVIVRTADAVIAVGGKYGTLSEIGLAMSINKPVFGLRTWSIRGVVPVKSPAEALDKIEQKIKSSLSPDSSRI
ncbi:MAG TPA: TIGR00725 family protein [Elusimicrobiota bacterium]|nr:TIGR00725 family protein [Elusimicrobiota bacterium]